VIDYDPFSDEALDDPNAIYKRLRAESPVHFVEKYESWALTLFEDIWSLSMDNEHFTATKGTSSPYLLTKAIPALPNLNHMDPPEQTQLRTAMMHFFMPRRVNALEDRIRGWVTDCIDAFYDKGRGDIVDDLAQIIAVKVTCEAAGFPEADADMMLDLVARFVAREEGVEGMTEDGIAAFGEILGYLAGLAAERRKYTGEIESPIDVLVRAESNGEPLSDDIVGQHLLLLLVGGTDTFPKVMSTALTRLEEHPDQRAQLVSDPRLIPQALQECLRFDMPTQFLMRTVSKEFELRGQKMQPGHSIMFVYPSGNRDERVFDDPDRFDIHRENARILSFGHGSHRCLGAHFAKLEGRIMLEEVLRRMPEYRIDHSSAKFLRTEFVRGHLQLPFEF
jgi:cytochrome P450